MFITSNIKDNELILYLLAREPYESSPLGGDTAYFGVLIAGGLSNLTLIGG